MKPPNEPRQEDCCNSGCNPCIFDVYSEQLRLYELFRKSGVDSSISETENALSQLEYVVFTVVNKSTICSSHILLEFKRKESIKCNKKVQWNPGDHLLLKYVSQELRCTRAYTPIKTGSDECDFAIVVKVYNHGVVSKYLNQLEIGDETQWRGPYGIYKINPNKYCRIIMIAQGTGILPFISIIEEIVSNYDDMTRLILYYCVKSEDTILFRDKLYSLKQYWNFSCKVFLSNVVENKNYKYQEPIIEHKLDVLDFCELNPSATDQVLICGSLNFMENIKNVLREKFGDIDNSNIVVF